MASEAAVHIGGMHSCMPSWPPQLAACGRPLAARCIRLAGRLAVRDTAFTARRTLIVAALGQAESKVDATLALSANGLLRLVQVDASFARDD